ncbi:B3 domain-containing protein REM3-like [Nicotiana sylvestris]|uniref:B3 domain-containing protein REM3-like n=1 Tax=Nicotiana sylvestris TaxID=4096 RepID=UPI00388C98A9
MFEVVTNGETPIWKFQVVTDGETPVCDQDKPSPRIKLSNKASSHVEAATKKPFGQSYFKCTLGEYCLSSGFLSGLIIRDKRQRLWNFKLNSWKNKTEAYIGDGWRKFIVDNSLKKGDRVMFEVVTNGETPIWKFQVVTDGETPVRDQGKYSLLWR